MEGDGGGSWHLGQLHGAVRPLLFDDGVLSYALALGCWIWATPDVALFNSITSPMVGKW